MSFLLAILNIRIRVPESNHFLVFQLRIGVVAANKHKLISHNKNLVCLINAWSEGFCVGIGCVGSFFSLASKQVLNPILNYVINRIIADRILGDKVYYLHAFSIIVNILISA